MKNLLEKLVKQDVIEASNFSLKELEEYQKYKLYKTAYMTSFLWSITGKCNYNTYINKIRVAIKPIN